MATLISWTIQQIAIFAWFTINYSGRALVVRARAGTGKTTTIKEGIKRLVADATTHGVTINVLATSFTKKTVAALDTALRGIPGVTVKSLNQLGYMFCREHGAYLTDASKIGRAWDLVRAIEPKADREAQALIVKAHTQARTLLPLAQSGAELIGMCEHFGIVPTEAMEHDGWTLAGLCDAAYDCMVLAAQVTNRGIDFADQIFLPLRKGWIRRIFDRVIVDETQDMTEAQLLLAQLTCKGDAGFCIVGDDQQAIFGFRGADVNGLDRLKSLLGADECGLTVTYRCPKSHVVLAQAYVPDYSVGEDAPDGEIAYPSIGHMLDQVNPGDFILSRTNAPLMKLCMSLIRDGKRAYVAGRDFGAMLHNVVTRCKASTIAELLPALATWEAKELAKVNADKRAEHDEWLTKATEKITDQSETIRVVAEGCTFTKELTVKLDKLFSEPKEGEDPSVMLATVHKAKGLEADAVYLCEGTFKERCQEDRRIRYVALTRSKRLLAFVSGFDNGAMAIAA